MIEEVHGTDGVSALSAAVNSFANGSYGIIIVHGWDGNYSEITVGDNKTIALLAAQGESPVIQGEAGERGVRVESGAVLYMDGLHIMDSGKQGLLVAQGRAWVDRGRIVYNSGGGVRVTNLGELVLRNSFVGGDIAGVDAASVEGASLSVLYSTLVGGAQDDDEYPAALRCADPVDIVVRNSILATNDSAAEVVCIIEPGAISFTATENPVAGGGNVALNDLDAMWFNDLATDFSLDSPPSGMQAVAKWLPGDPTTDIHGDQRRTDGSLDYPGADVPMTE
ncbi:hypothetical protein OEB96_45335 [Paraliomyxa miuraensis]|nr:hypothetical protein [Paraliomyxa miuraensis]